MKEYFKWVFFALVFSLVILPMPLIISWSDGKRIPWEAVWILPIWAIWLASLIFFMKWLFDKLKF